MLPDNFLYFCTLIQYQPTLTSIFNLPLSLAILLTICTTQVPFAQNTAVQEFPYSEPLQDSVVKKDTGEVKVYGNNRLTALIDFYTNYTREVNLIPGYRIEIFSESGLGSKNKARKVQAAFRESFEDIPGYVKWEYPNFEVRVGDFRSKIEAEKNLNAIKEVFPFAFIKQDMIEPPALNKPNTEK